MIQQLLKRNLFLIISKAHFDCEFESNRNYLLRRYILGALMHTTAWDQNWGGDETLK